MQGFIWGEPELHPDCACPHIWSSTFAISIHASSAWPYVHERGQHDHFGITIIVLTSAHPLKPDLSLLFCLCGHGVSLFDWCVASVAWPLSALQVLRLVSPVSSAAWPLQSLLCRRAVVTASGRSSLTPKICVPGHLPGVLGGYHV